MRILFFIPGLGGLFGILVAVPLVGAAVLHVLSPHTTVTPLLKLAGIVALGGVGFVAVCGVLFVLPIVLVKTIASRLRLARRG
jgi:hypothetical protein